MTAAKASSQATNPDGSFIKQKSKFRNQREELHRLHKTQKESTEEFKAATEQLLWLADFAICIGPHADFELLVKMAKLDKKKTFMSAPTLASRSRKTGKLQVPKPPANGPIPKKKRTPRRSTHWWDIRTKGRRSRRIPDEDPLFTFERGALLTRWR